MDSIVLAMVFRYPDGSFTFNFWYVCSVALLMMAGGSLCLVAPESFRAHYFNFVRTLSRVLGGRSESPREGLGWGSAASIRIGGAVAIALGVVLMTWVFFFTVPGRAY